MPTKNFYTANGMIMGESSGGTTTVYAPDGLGNTAATYSGGVKQNSYLYAPYGTQIAKTGSAADPKFLWNGGSGYRNTGRSYADLYVRARHYGTLTGQWTGMDAYWPSEPAYVYVLARPCNDADPSGNLLFANGCTTGSVGPVPVGTLCPPGFGGFTSCNTYALINWSAGNQPYTCICTKDPCIVDCVERHESINFGLIASACRNSTGQFGVYKAWYHASQDKIDCNGYAAEASCLQAKLGNCVAVLIKGGPDKLTGCCGEQYAQLRSVMCIMGTGEDVTMEATDGQGNVLWSGSEGCGGVVGLDCHGRNSGFPLPFVALIKTLKTLEGLALGLGHV